MQGWQGFGADNSWFYFAEHVLLPPSVPRVGPRRRTLRPDLSVRYVFSPFAYVVDFVKAWCDVLAAAKGVNRGDQMSFGPERREDQYGRM